MATEQQSTEMFYGYPRGPFYATINNTRWEMTNHMNAMARNGWCVRSVTCTQSDESDHGNCSVLVVYAKNA